MRSGWAALVVFAGVGNTGRMDISEWLARKTGELPPDAKFEDLLRALRQANIWLQTVPRGIRRHTFSVGAFVGVLARLAMVSNYETTFGLPREQARSEMMVSFRRPTRPKLLLAGRPTSVTRAERAYLVHLLQEDVSADQMFQALWRVNRQAASRDSTISPSCFTTYLRKTGEGGGRALGLDEAKDYMPTFARRMFGQDLGLVLRRGVDEQGQPKPLRLVQFAMARTEATDEWHREQLKAKPNSAEAHSNYGAFLYDVKKDVDGAERAYTRALEIDPNWCNALGNYANLLRNDRGDMDAAQGLYKHALAADPRNTIQIRNYASFLSHVRNDVAGAEDLYRAGLHVNPSDENLLHDYADLLHRQRRAREAADVWERYIVLRPRDGEALGACAACHMMAGGDPQRSEQLCRLALEQQPDLPGALVNLAQLDLLSGRDDEAGSLLERCVAAGASTDAELEAWFYRYAYQFAEDRAALAEVRRLILAGFRSPGWDLATTAEHAIERGHGNPELIRVLATVITDPAASPACLDAFPDWVGAGLAA